MKFCIWPRIPSQLNAPVNSSNEILLCPDQMPKPPQWTPSNAQKYFYPKNPCYE